MTVAEQLIRQGMQQGMQQGIYLVAKNLLKNGLDASVVGQYTGLSSEVIVKLSHEKNQ